MKSYILSSKAEEDISSIYDYTAHEHGILQAEAYLVSLHETLTMLAEKPNMGSCAEVIRKNYLKFPIHKHMVFYKIEDDSIWIVRVLHQQMKYGMHLSD